MARRSSAPFDTTLSFRRQATQLREATCWHCKISHVWDGDPEPANALCPDCAKPIRGAGKAARSKTTWVCAAPVDMTAPPPEPAPPPPPPPKPTSIVEKVIEKVAAKIIGEADSLAPGKYEVDRDGDEFGSLKIPEPKSASPEKKRDKRGGNGENGPSDDAV